MRTLAALCLAFAYLAVSGCGDSKPEAPAATWKVYTQWPFDAAEAKRRQAETAKALGVKVEQDIDLGGGVKLTLVLIPAGEFVMGSGASAADVMRLSGLVRFGPEYFTREHPQHRVRIPQPLWMGKYEVTQAEWEGVMDSNPSIFKGARNPVDRVSWNDIQGFLEKLNGLLRGEPVALPTEAQWEYACRAGTSTPFHFGDTISTEQANYDGRAKYGNGRKGVYRQKAVSVGSFPANAWGLHDMHGNLWEWCEDWEDSGYYAQSPASDPRGPNLGKARVIRGGSWGHSPVSCRSANRAGLAPKHRDGNRGFRVVLSAKPSP